MRILSFLLLTLIFYSCQDENTNQVSNKSDSLESINNLPTDEELNSDNEHEYNEGGMAREPDFCDTLHSYFKRHEINPLIDNSYNDGNDTTTYFKIGNHIINWHYNASSTIVRIDNHEININNKGFEGPYSIRGIRLFLIDKIEILAIEFFVVGCGGGCFGGNSLFYDFKNKNENYYSYAAMNCFSLYDFSHDNTIDLLVPHLDGDVYGGDPFTEKYSIYELNSKGFFFPKKDKYGRGYFVKVEYPERSPESQCEIKSINWFEKIK